MHEVIYSFHMPAFFFIVGMVWNDKQESFGSFIKKKFIRLGIPYFIWGVLSLLVFMLLEERSIQGVWKNVAGLLLGTGWPNGFKYNSPLWFLPCMFTVTVCYWVYSRLISWEYYKVWHLILIPICLYLYHLSVCRLNIQLVPWGGVKALGFMGAVVIGRVFNAEWLNRLKNNGGNVRNCLWGCVLLVLGISGVMLADVLHHELFLKGFIYSAFRWLASLASVIGFILLFLKCELRCLCWLGACSLGVMVVHKFPIVFFQMKCPIPVDAWILCAGIPMMIILFVLTFAISLTTVYLVKKTIPWMLGECSNIQ